ncbi:gamma-glutamyltransferase family protein [Vibrio fluvialis]|uniref:gamma-glutamyltransferase family protein n=1 Tax=Vibrio fluvialis TaxID=676 RepID=UPI0015587727|nr:gamma-glutamyltransferase family protein [Vibrio fluvialis]EKO3368493.1 gamma-glutamyltransferase family protein [Vibrio fluvialis]ELW1731641.1 gamma-glutamyltransferase family protein [Vibrio fluvialis]MBY7906412.1 gamma-glutamyltransferase family protein [Vibrio fluvialis]MBY8176454.1 gamma-glutamyltransferase family protein [Vibrio fluvialis]MBY8198100.1 gamma-glutamyltransferase family protein [Vibrio fluvialis]
MKHQTAFTAPHFKAAQVGQQILDAGGTASEAMVAAAAMIAVQYPHMNGIGGDSFWLIAKAGQTPVAIDGCGAAALNVDVEHYRALGDELPFSGGESAITMAGTIAAWQKALEVDAGTLTLTELLQPAIDAARDGVEVTQSLVNASEKTFERLASLQAFAQNFLKQGKTLKVGDTLVNEALANTLQALAERGLDDFYRGEIAASAAKELQAAGSPLTLDDFHAHQAKVMAPLTVNTAKGRLYNFGAPTQGVASLLILAIYDRLASQAQSEVDHIHLLVEATKQAFIIRDREVCDEEFLSQPLQEWLIDSVVDQCAANVSLNGALPWPHEAKPGDTIWMGASDQYGTMVSFIQSVYWEFGSGVFLPETGILWNIRSKSFSLDARHHNVLAPGKKPFHTLNPAYAELADGRRMSYGTMGGEGQPQTQACLFSRYHYQNFSLSDAIAAPRWLLGRTWGNSTNNLRLEQSLYEQYGDALKQRGHDVTFVADCNELMGHAGAIILDTHGKACATSDPRSDGTSLLGE